MNFSKRIIEFAKKGEFVLDWSQVNHDWLRLSFNNHQIGIYWQCDWDKSTYQLKLSINHSLNDLDIAYLEAFCHLSRSVNFTKMNLISFRDLENYLRDENHLLAHDKELEHQILAIKWIEEIKKELMKPLFQDFFKYCLRPFGSIADSKNLSKYLDGINRNIRLQQKLGPYFSQSEIIAVIPLDHTARRFEVQWRFHPEIEAVMAQALCLCLEEIISNESLLVKVVAESSGAELS